MAKILIIDDDTVNIQIYDTKLKAEKYEVVVCESGEEALKKISEKFDLILLDIMMPKIDGVTLLKEIVKSVNKNSVILIHTNLLSEKVKKECLENGAKEYLIKADLTPTLLLAKIKNYLHK